MNKWAIIRTILKVLAWIVLGIVLLAWIGYYFATCQPFSMRPIGELPSICLYLSRH